MRGDIPASLSGTGTLRDSRLQRYAEQPAITGHFVAQDVTCCLYAGCSQHFGDLTAKQALVVGP